ncbi:MAG TPA: hypothetical protein VMW41_06845 [Candidatus Bathyarchaeia archaeon]|nr:hypothetical protein [Candidatus Bathyarchaeia archaeon]
MRVKREIKNSEFSGAGEVLNKKESSKKGKIPKFEKIAVFIVCLFVLLIVSYFWWFGSRSGFCGGFMGTGCPPGFVCRYQSGDTGKCLPFFMWRLKRKQPDGSQNLSPAPVSETSESESKQAEGKFCGGIAANLPEFQCPTGYRCQLEGNYPDVGGKCVSITLF